MAYQSQAAIDRLRRSPELVVQLCVGLAFAAFFLGFTPAYEGQDDVVFSEIVSGRYTGSASPYLVFVHIWLGRLWVWLYHFWPTMPWYSLSIYAAHFLAWSLLAQGAIKLDKTWRGWVVLGSAFLSLGLPTLIKPQYTSTSILSFAAGIFYFMVMSRRGLRLWPCALAAAAAVASELFRPLAFQASLLFSAPVLVAFIWRRIRAREKLLPALAAGGLIIALGLGMGAFHDAAHRRDQWRSYVSFNLDAYEISNKPRVDPKLYGGLEQIGFTANDTELIHCVFYPDAEHFSPEKMRRARELIDGSRRPLKFKRAWKLLRAELKATYTIEGLFLLAAALFLCGALTWGERLILLALLAAHLALLTYFYWRFQRFPFRVIQPSFLFPLIGLLLVAGSRRGEAAAIRGFRGRLALGAVLTLSLEFRPTPTLRRLSAAGARLLGAAALVLMILGCATTQVAYARYHSRLNALNQRQHLEELRRIRRLDPEGVYLAWGAIGFFRTPPFMAPAELPPLNSIHATWLTQSPHWNANMKRFALDDVALDLARRRDVYLIGDRFSIELYKTFMRERHGLETEARPLAPIQRCFVDIKTRRHAPDTCQCVLTVFEVRPRSS